MSDCYMFYLLIQYETITDCLLLTAISSNSLCISGLLLVLLLLLSLLFLGLFLLLLSTESLKEGLKKICAVALSMS